MDNQNYKKSLYLFLFCLFYSLNVFVTHIINSQYIVGFSDYDAFVKMLKMFSYPLLCMLLLFYQLNKNTFFDFFISVLFFISFFISGYSIIVYVVFLLARMVSFRYIIYSYLLSIFIGLFFVFVTYVFGLYDTSYLDLFRNGSYRNIMGYRFPTYLPNVLCSVYFCWIYLRKNKLSFLEMLIMLLLSYILYELTDTRTVFYMTILLLGLVFFIRFFSVDFLNSSIISHFLKMLTIYIFPILCLLSLCLCYFYDENVDWMYLLNKILSGRLYYANTALAEHGIPLFGVKINYVPMLKASEENPFFVIDIGFILFLMNHGFVLLMLVSYGFVRVGKFIVKRNEPYFAVSVIFFISQMLINPYLTVLDFNPFFFLLSYYTKELMKKNI